jgi:putative hydrolase of the HAD superfamily
MSPVTEFPVSGPTAVVFDGDDTLWSTEPLYDQARNAARAEVVRAGLDGEAWEQAERQIDVENVSRLGFSVERFPTSCVQAYDAVARASGQIPSPQVADRVRAAARTVFDLDPPLMPGAREMLLRLRSTGVRLALLTKGDAALQERRIERSGIADLFDVIRIVPEKPPEAFRAVAAALGVELDDAWSVGNSVRSDIMPAIDAGLRAVWIDAHVWEHERFVGTLRHDRIVAVRDLANVADVISGVSVEAALEH